jgi:hypothetical protein
MSALLDPSTGPVPREKFAEIVNAPFGHAAKLIRKYDPLWGLPAGAKIKWKVECRRTLQYGTAYVEATSDKAAAAEAEDLCGDDVDWDNDPDDFDIISIEPEVSK